MMTGRTPAHASHTLTLWLVTDRVSRVVHALHGIVKSSPAYDLQHGHSFINSFIRLFKIEKKKSNKKHNFVNFLLKLHKSGLTTRYATVYFGNKADKRRIRDWIPADSDKSESISGEEGKGEPLQRNKSFVGINFAGNLSKYSYNVLHDP